MSSTVIIIGAGWYGCYLAMLCKNRDIDYIVYEKNSDIFNNSSFYNQNRLHLGYHYPRSGKTRILCKKYFSRFQNLGLTKKIENNLYLISKNSLIDDITFKSIFSFENYNFTEIENKYFNNIYDN